MSPDTRRGKKRHRQGKLAKRDFMEKLNEKQMARAFEAFWAATGQPGGGAERQVASVAFAEMALAPYLAGELVSAALSDALGGQDVAGQL